MGSLLDETEQRGAVGCFASLRPGPVVEPDRLVTVGRPSDGRTTVRLVLHRDAVAEFYAKREHWAGAAGRLERLVSDYPGSPRESAALFQLAGAYLKLDDRNRARQTLEQLIVKHPQDPRRPQAEKLLASLR